MQKLRTDWKMSEIVKPEDFNRIGEVVNGLGARMTDLNEELENKVNVGNSMELPVEFVEGVTSYNGSTIFKNPFGETTITLSCRKVDTTQYFSHYEIIAVLPQGYRPKEVIEVNGTVNGEGGKRACTLGIATDGRVSLHITGIAYVGTVFCTVSFLAAQ